GNRDWHRRHVRCAGAGIRARDRRRPLAVRMDVGAGGDDLRRFLGDPAQHHCRARAGSAAGPLSTTTPVIDRLRARTGVYGAPVTAAVEAGPVSRFAAAIGGPRPRWTTEEPPT